MTHKHTVNNYDDDGSVGYETDVSKNEDEVGEDVSCALTQGSKVLGNGSRIAPWLVAP